MQSNFVEQINILNSLLVDNVKALLDNLGLHYRNNGEYISLACPVHSSNSPRSMNIVTNPWSDYVGTWTCWSHKCHEKFGRTLLGLIHGVLSTQKGCDVKKGIAIKYALDFLGLKSLSQLKVDENSVKKKSLLGQQIL